LINRMGGAKTFESLNDYNFLNWESFITLYFDMEKKVIPNYEDCSKETVEYVQNAVHAVLIELRKADRIVITECEKTAQEASKKRQLQRDEELKQLIEEYNSEEVAKAICANVYTKYLNVTGDKTANYQSALKWCVDLGIFNEIENRAL